LSENVFERYALRNTGNSCYVNSVLQCLNAIPSFGNLFDGYSNSNFIPVSDVDRIGMAYEVLIKLPRNKIKDKIWQLDQEQYTYMKV